MRKIILIVLLILTVPEISSQVRVLSETCLTHNSFDDRYGTYAPDGKAILFESNRDGNWEIYLMNNDGTDQKRLTFDGGNDRRPSWHPDGKKIVFESDRTGQFELYVLQLADKQLIKLTNTSNG